MQKIVRINFHDSVFNNLKTIDDLCKFFSPEKLETLFASYNCNLVSSKMMPYDNDKYYIVKPVAIIDGLLELNIKNHKYHRIMKYICTEDIYDFFSGTYSFEKKNSHSFGKIKKDESNKINFVLEDNVGLYFFIYYECSTFFSDELERIIVSFVKSMVFPGVLLDINFYDCSEELLGIKKQKSLNLMLSDIKTSNLTTEQIAYLTEYSHYQLGYYDNEKFVKVNAGACIKGELAPWVKEKTFVLQV